MFLKHKKLIWYLLSFVTILAALLLLSESENIQTSGELPPQILVIDPGHGGEDGGAVASNGTMESAINLDIALRLKALANFWGVSTVMTRETSTIEYPENASSLSEKKKADQNARVELIRETPNAILISIHQNFYPSSAPWGIQVFYGKIAGSDLFAEVTQKNLTNQLLPDNRRLATAIDENIYLMRMVRCPAILVECGFLSNENERLKLETEKYRLEVAAVLLASYQQYTEGIMR